MAVVPVASSYDEVSFLWLKEVLGFVEGELFDLFLEHFVVFLFGWRHRHKVPYVCVRNKSHLEGNQSYTFDGFNFAIPFLYWIQSTLADRRAKRDKLGGG